MSGAFAVYVVHSPRLVERRAPLEAALTHLGWPASWIEAPEFHGPLDWLRHRPHPRLSNGEVSVYLKQREALERIARGSEDMALVLEDDAILRPDLDRRLTHYLGALPEDADVVFFGASSDLVAEPLPAHALFGIGPRTRSLSGYWIRRDAARVLAARLDRTAIRWPIDSTIDQFIRDGDVVAYWSVPPLIENGSASGRYPRSILGGAWRSSGIVTLVRQWRRRWRQRRPAR